MVFASRSKRCLATGSAEILAGKILTATSLPRRVSFARYTSPIPPAPSGATTSYGPSLVPELRAIVARHYTPNRSCPIDANLKARWVLQVSGLHLGLGFALCQSMQK